MADLQWNRDFALEQTSDDEEVLAELLEIFRDFFEVRLNLHLVLFGLFLPFPRFFFQCPWFLT